MNLGDWGNINSGLGYVTGAVINRVDKILIRNYNGSNKMSIIRTPSWFPYNIRVSACALKTTSTILKGTSYVAGGGGILLTAYQFGVGQISGGEAVVDGLFGVIGFFGPLGAGVSIIYFGGKALYEYFSGETLFEKPGGQ